MKYIIDSLIQVHTTFAAAGKEAIAMLSNGKSVDLIVVEHSSEKPRSVPQNKLIYLAYHRIGQTLYGGDELLARNECKLKIGCAILYRESEEFQKTFDKIIRPLPYETKLEAMELISVSSIMTVKQCNEYITQVLNQYTLKGVFFADLDGANEYLKYPEAVK